MNNPTTAQLLPAVKEAVKTVASAPRISVRNPSCYWKKDDMKHRAYITCRVVKHNGAVSSAEVFVGRSFYRGGERVYKNVTPASLARVNRLFPFAVL